MGSIAVGSNRNRWWLCVRSRTFAGNAHETTLLGSRTWGGIVLACLTACATAPTPPAQSQGQLPTSTPESHAARSPFTEPPGMTWSAVTQSNIGTTICTAGWTAIVRPSTSYTQGVKRKMLRDAHLPEADAIKYELDHFVPLALGGHPRSIDNLWLQRWDGAWNARVKDHLERALQVKVCKGEVTLLDARSAIEQSWKRAYEKYVGRSRDLPEHEEFEEEAVVE